MSIHLKKKPGWAQCLCLANNFCMKAFASKVYAFWKVLLKNHNPRFKPRLLQKIWTLKGVCHEIFSFNFFHNSVFPGSLSIPLGPFQIFSKIREDIGEWMFVTGINYTSDKLFTGVNEVHPQNVRFQNIWFQNVQFQNVKFTKRQVYKTSGFKMSGFKTSSF